MEEAQAGQSKLDFISQNAIALKEARETVFWLRLLAAACPLVAFRDFRPKLRNWQKSSAP